MVTAALRPLAATLPTYTGMQSQDGTYVVIRVLKSQTTEAQPEEVAMRKAELAHLYSNAEIAAYIEGLRAKFGVEILKDEYKPGYQPTEADAQ